VVSVPPDEPAQQASDATGRARRRRRQQAILLGGVLAAVALVAIWWVFVRDVPSRCARLVGPIAELEQLVGVELKLGYSFTGKSHCNQTVARRDSLGAGSTVVTLEVQSRGDFAGQLARRKRDKFVDHLALSLATGEAHLFVAGEATKRTTEDLMADAERRVGRSRDPIGDVLAELPPEQHVVILRYSRNLVTLSLAPGAFTLEQAKAYAAAVAQRAKRE